jgi:hypothetical protein
MESMLIFHIVDLIKLSIVSKQYSNGVKEGLGVSIQKVKSKVTQKDHSLS